MDMVATAELAELRQLALGAPGSTRLLDLAIIATLERLAVELERLAGPGDDAAGSTPAALRSSSATGPPTR